MANNIQLSIVTVIYNDLERFIPTFKNVCNTIDKSNNKDKLEYLVKDGNSTDGISKYFEKNECIPDYVRFIAREDGGIYSAMNQAIDYVNGDYMIFINAGDLLLPRSLDKCFQYFGQAEILAFDYKKGGEIKKQENFEGTFLHRSPCHQAIISQKKITKFSEQYDLASDYDFLLNNRFKIKWIRMPISVFSNELKPKSYQERINREKIDIILKSNIPFIKKLFSIIALLIK